MSTKVFLLLFLFAIFCKVECWKKFHLGQKVGGLPPPKGPQLDENEVEEGRFTQHMQNFNLLLLDLFWDQRYFVNDEYYNANSKKVFLIVGGAQIAHKEWVKYGPWAEAAKEHGALMFMLEHRYYGRSPTNEPNLRFETSEQALEDLARFISGMNEKYNLPSDVKWYAFGGSYGGTLAVWLRARYPHLVAGAVSISAPLQPVIDYSGYLQVVVDELSKHSKKCVNDLEKGFKQLDQLIQAKNTNQINSLFNLCDSFEDSFDNTKDIANLFQILSEEFGAVTQFHNVEDILDISTHTLCDVLVAEQIGTELERLALVNSLFLHKTEQSCLEYKYQKMVDEYRNETITETTNMRQWFYHTCHKLGWYPTSNQNHSVFGNKFPASFFVDLCMDVNSIPESIINTGVRFTRNKFGGLDVKATNVLFVHGTTDPWYPVGITETKDTANKAIFIKGSGHCAAMYSESTTDNYELRKAKREIAKTIRIMVNGEPLSTLSCATRGNIILRNFNIALILIVALLVGIGACVIIKLWGYDKKNDRNSFSSEATVIPEKGVK